MARTYRAEGRQLANILRALFVGIGVLIYYLIPGLHWGFFFAFIFIGVLIAEILGVRWTRYRREQKQAKKKGTSKGKSTSVKTSKVTETRR